MRARWRGRLKPRSWNRYCSDALDPAVVPEGTTALPSPAIAPALLYLAHPWARTSGIRQLLLHCSTSGIHALAMPSPATAPALLYLAHPWARTSGIHALAMPSPCACVRLARRCLGAWRVSFGCGAGTIPGAGRRPAHPCACVRPSRGCATRSLREAGLTPPIGFLCRLRRGSGAGSCRTLLRPCGA